MFKKLKDKIAEEVKQSPSKISATVSQIAQAVVSPSSSSVVEPSLATDNHFSISDDIDETPRNSPSKWGFTSVDLREAASPQPPGVGSQSRRTSISSVLSDASSLFPVYESPGNAYHLQSDLESASEMDESFSSQLPSTSKEQLVNILRKTQQRYNKYKGRYSDLARHYRELERENVKAKAILTESQDKALRRIAELKEQCLLEQRAKAHLEEILRNDLEEKDHLIMTLNTKIDLLKLDGGSTDTSFSAGNSASNFTEVPATPQIVADMQSSVKEDSSDNTGTLIDVTSNTVVNELNLSAARTEPEDLLREKVRKLEMLLAKCKDAIKIHKEKVKEFSAENQYLQTQLAESKESSSQQAQQLTAELTAAREQIATLQTREEESALSLAETKRTIHSEMEVKEEQITHLRDTIHAVNEQKQELTEKCSQLHSQVTEMKRLQEMGISSENDKQIQELSRVKQEAVKLLHAETQKNMSELKESMYVQIQVLENQVQAFAKSNNEMEAQHITIKNEVTQLENQNFALLDEQRKLNDQVVALQGQTKQLESDNGALLNESRQFEEASTEAALANSELSKKLDEVLAENLNLRAYIENARQLKEIMEEEYEDVIKLKSQIADGLEVRQMKREVEYANRQDYVELLECHLDDKNEVNQNQFAALSRYAVANEELANENRQLVVSTALLKSEHEAMTHNSQLMSVQKQENEDIIEQSKVKFQEHSETISRLLEEKNKLAEIVQKKDTHIDELNVEVTTLNEDVMRLNNSSFGDISSLQTELENERKRARDLVNKIKLEKSVTSKEISHLYEQIEMEKAGAIATISKLNKRIENDKAKASAKIKKLQEKQEQARTTISNLQQQLAVEKDQAMETIGKLNELIEEARTEASAEMSKREQCERDINTEINMLKEELKLANTTISNVQEQKKTDHMVAMDTVGKLNEIIQDERTKANAAIQKQEQLETERNAVKNTLEGEQELSRAAISNLQDQMHLEKMEAIATINDLKEQIEYDRTKASAAVTKQEEMESEKTKACATINMLEEQQQVASATISNLQQKVELQKSQAMVSITKLNEVIENERKTANDTITKLQEINSDSENKLSESSKLAIEQENRNAELVKSIQSHESLVEELNKRNSEFLLAAEKEHELLSTELNLLRVKEKELSLMLQMRTDELEEKTDSCLLLQQKLTDIEELPEKIVLMREEINKINDKNTVLLEQIQSNAENQPDWSKIVEEAKSELQAVMLEKCKLEKDLQAKLELEAEMSKTIQQLNNEKQQLGSHIGDVQLMQQNIDKLLGDVGSLEQKLSDSLQTIAEKESEMNDMQESHRHKIKQLARDFDDKLHDREEEMSKMHDDEKANQEQTEGVLAKQLRNQIKALKADARQSEVIIENLKERHNDAIKSKEFELSSLEERMKAVDLTHETELQECEKKWRQWLDREMEARDASHKEEVAALSKEWHWERKKHLNSNESAQPQELENTSQVAVAAVESGTGSLELMHRQLMAVTQELKEAKRKHKSEALELRRIMGSQLNVSEATELEYLRNILFEYMMGHQTTVLARVIATVLKFDQEQTKKVIEKEEHKQSLLGQLGIL